MNRTLVISDVHLASRVCRAEPLLRLLRSTDHDRLIILGDLFDHGNLRRLARRHWKLIHLIGQLARRNSTEVIWVEGNHDKEVIRLASPMLGATVVRQNQHYALEQGGRRYLFLHGHQFDTIIARNPVLTAVGTGLFSLIQILDGEQKKFSRWIKRRSKALMKASEENCDRALLHAKKHAADVIVCGHTHWSGHVRRDGVEYINTGSWVDTPSHYLLIDSEGFQLRADIDDGGCNAAAGSLRPGWRGAGALNAG